MNYEGIGIFRVPIYLECRTERHNNLRDFLKESVQNFKSPKEVIYDAFKEVKGQVFLIDGYDEVNDNSRELVEEIIDFCSKYNATVIVTGRVDAGNNLIRNLEDRNLSYNEMLIEPISKISDKLSFLMRYGDKMGDVIDSVELVKSFEDLNDTAQEVFVSPVHLALFISLFLNNRNSLSQLHNEQNTYKAIRDIFAKEIEKKLREINIPNPEGRTKDILAVFSYYSHMLFMCEKYFFEEDDYESLVENCEQKLSRDVDIKGLLTCILIPETSLKQGKTLTYAFAHSTIQEYLAVEQIIKNMRERNFDWNSEHHSGISLRKNFLECVGLSTIHHENRDKVERYGNIIKLLILETLATGEITKYTKTFIAILWRYFGFREFLFNLVSSSNCDSAIASIVYNARKSRTFKTLDDSRRIRPMTEILKNRKIGRVIQFQFTESLTYADCVNLGQLMAVLEDDSEIRILFRNSYYDYEPVNGEFYTQLENIKCKVSQFTACLASSDHLSMVMKVFRGDYYDNLSISAMSACDFSFAALEGYRGIVGIRVKYTDDCPSTGSNPVTEETELIITDIPENGRSSLFSIIKFLCPKSNEFARIELVKCHLTHHDINELMYKLQKEKIRAGWRRINGVEERWVNKDRSRDLYLHLDS